MKQPAYSEHVVGWNQDDFQAGVTTYGVSNYEGTAKLKIPTPVRPALLPLAAVRPDDELFVSEGHPLALM